MLKSAGLASQPRYGIFPIAAVHLCSLQHAFTGLPAFAPSWTRHSSRSPITAGPAALKATRMCLRLRSRAGGESARCVETNFGPCHRTVAHSRSATRSINATTITITARSSTYDFRTAGPRSPLHPHRDHVPLACTHQRSV